MISRKVSAWSASLLLAGLVANAGAESLDADVSPKKDLEAIQKFFTEKFPEIAWEDFANGAYALDEVLYENWQLIEEFPPYEIAVGNGEEMWNTPFANGKSYADCFGEPGVQHHYPRWDKEQGQVVTLALAINQCREAHGEEPLKYKKGPIVDLLAYMAYESRGQIINVVVPEDDPGALEAYKKGREFYFTRRGQLNFACAHCHFSMAGRTLRTEPLSPALGQATGWPVYRSKWGAIGTLHRRYTGCNKQVRAKPFEAQGEEYRNLEYFHTHMSNGLPLNGPAARK